MVIALACALPEPLADIACLDTHRCFHSLCGPRLNVSRATIRPQLHQRAVRAISRIGARKRDLRDALPRHRDHLRVIAQEVPLAPIRVGTDHQKVIAGIDKGVADARRGEASRVSSSLFCGLRLATLR